MASPSDSAMMDKPQASLPTELSAMLIPFPRDENFLDRPKIFEQMTEVLKNQRRLVLCGPSGIG
jgi:hypothetical protein